MYDFDSKYTAVRLYNVKTFNQAKKHLSRSCGTYGMSIDNNGKVFAFGFLGSTPRASEEYAEFVASQNGGGRFLFSNHTQEKLRKGISDADAD